MALVEDGDAIGNGERFRQVVSGVGDGYSGCGDVAYEGDQAGGGDRIEAASGLIQQEHAGILKQGSRNRQALVHPGGELHDLLAAGVGELYLLQGGFDAGRTLAAGNILERGEKLEIFARGESGKEGSLCGEGYADALPYLGRMAPGIQAVHQDAALVRQEHGRDQP